MTYNIYCDESCHLENDKIKPMVLGCVWCPLSKVKNISREIRNIKSKYVKPSYELKWTKVSPNHVDMYSEIIDYFFDNDNLHFRGVVIPDKTILTHEKFSQNHDDWYYKMCFILLKTILSPNEEYNIYLDYKDSLGSDKVQKLEDILLNNAYDFSHTMIKNIQLVKSHQVELIQLTDLFIGALSYLFRSLETNEGKLNLISKIKERSGYNLQKNTLYRETKMNLLIWSPKKDCFDD